MTAQAACRELSVGSRTCFSVEWKTALATRDRCAGDAAFANSASTGHCQAPRSRADLACRPSTNRSPLRDFCLPSNLGSSFDAPDPQDSTQLTSGTDAEFSAHAESAA